MTLLPLPLPTLSASGWPDELLRRPFTSAQARAHGVTQTALRHALAVGFVRRVLRGVFVSAALGDTPQLRSAALSLVVAPHQILVDRTAAWLYGVDALTWSEHRQWPPIEVCALRGSTRTRHSTVRGRTRDLAGSDVATVGALAATTPRRTALDLGCALHHRDAYAAMNGLAAAGGFTGADLVRELPRFAGRRGVVQLRLLAPLVDPRPESPRESWTLLEILANGLPAPELQYVVDDGERQCRLDFAYPEHRVAVEYDGAEFHELTDRQRVHDAERRRWLRSQGWVVIVLRKGDFSGDRLVRWVHELRRALADSCSNRRW